LEFWRLPYLRLTIDRLPLLGRIDSYLVQQALLGSPMSTTATELFERHAVTVYRYFCRMTGSPDLAEDLTQDVFVRVIRGLHRYDARDREVSWLFSIVRHVLTDCRATPQIDVIRLDDIDEPAQATGHVTALAYDDALRLLAPGDRAVYLLREQAGLSYAEVAKVCEVSEQAVRSRLFRARRNIKRVLSDWLLHDREGSR
jgi:RNA polymerase sigma-70 factor, ECF subfamily